MAAKWISQGPDVIQGGFNVEIPTKPGQTLPERGGSLTGPQVGSIRTVVAHPTNADIIYIGTINGGVWRSTNATAPEPTWTPLTDNLSSLSIGALDLDPTDANRQTLVAGIGNFSAANRRGGILSTATTGLLRSTDGGNTWTEFGVGGINNLNFSAVAARGNIILAAAINGIGLFRSNDAGASFQTISGTDGTGLPRAGITSLVGDPANPQVFYAAVIGNGIYRSDNSGATWVAVTPPEATIGDQARDNVKIAVGNNGVVYVGVVNDGRLSGVFQSRDRGTNWRSLGIPITQPGDIGIHPGRQGGIHFSFVADPNNPDIFYVGGDRQPSGQEEGTNPQFPNSSGANSYGGRLFRGQVGANGAQYTSITHNDADPDGSGSLPGTAPHADSRGMVFDARGNLIQIDDGGIYRRSNPTSSTGVWSNLNNRLRITEFYSIDFDSTTGRMIGGAQDNGASRGRYSADGKAQNNWDEVVGGDGGRVLVDDSNNDFSIHYSSAQRLGSFRRQTIDKATGRVDTKFLRPVIGDTKQTIYQAEKNGSTLPFVTPIELNQVDPTRLILVSNSQVYESMDQGSTLSIAGTVSAVNAIAYGGKSGGQNNPDVIYVGSRNSVLLRTKADEALTPTAESFPGGNILDIVLNPNDWNQAYVLNANSVYRTANAGQSWDNITGNLFTAGTGAVEKRLETIEFISAGTGGKDALIVGGLGGVFSSTSFDKGSQAQWTKFGEGLPNALVRDVKYDAKADILLAGTLGRGAWTVANVKAEFGAAGATPAFAPPAQDGSVEIYVGNAAAPEDIDELEEEEDRQEDIAETDEDLDDDIPEPKLTFVVNLSEPSDEVVTVQYSTADGNATAGSDYTPVRGTLTFAPGQTTQTVEIEIADDEIPEPGQYFLLNIFDATGGEIADGQGFAEIIDDEAGDGGDDFLIGSLGEDEIAAGAGNDLIFGESGDDEIDGGAGDDTISGNRGNDTIRGAEGNDILRGGRGNDLMFGNLGNDQVYGDKGNDTVNGNQGNDTVLGGSGSDIVRGGKDDDIVRGGKDDDQVFGDLGNDSIYGDLGADTLTGGEGSDRFVISRVANAPTKTTGGISLVNADVIVDFKDGQDLIALTGGLTFADLLISQGTGANAADTIFQDKGSQDFLAILRGVNQSQISIADFTTI